MTVLLKKKVKMIRIVTEYQPEKFAAAVNALLTDGWKLRGKTIVNVNTSYYYQVLVFKE
jgi:hypothetical protein